jgi:hypothetical protein
VAELSLQAFRGDTNIYDLTATRTVAGVTSPVPLTGASIWFTAKRKLADADVNAVIRKGNGPTGFSGITVTDASNGLATLTILPADSASLEAGDVRLYCDVQVKEADGTTSTTKGHITFAADVTQAS